MERGKRLDRNQYIYRGKKGSIRTDIRRERKRQDTYPCTRHTNLCTPPMVLV